MFRAVAAIVAVAMLSISGSAALQHVHAYVGHDHDHEDHDHGPAAHAHAPPTHVHHAASHASDHSAELKGCDPGQHVVTLQFVCAAPERDHAPTVMAIETVSVRPPPVVWSATAPSDVRAHSPPRLTDAPLRAPPVVHPA